VDFFRSLLAMTPIERRESLANRTPEAQKLILAKLQEYQSLRPEESELRLRVTELRWYLLPLLSTPATNRAAALSAVPAGLRNLLEDRLHEWDKLDAEVQKELLENESTVRFYFELAARTPEQQAESVTNMPAAGREKLESGLRRWQALTDEHRQAVVVHFNQFFDLTAAEKEQTLRTLSEPERLQIEKTLRTFGSLTPGQRAECLRSFQKFASLSPEERQQFLKNAERWERMTPSERQSWRKLVSSLSRQPPLPPGFRVPIPGPPPPILRQPSSAPASWATNSN
jgi:DNA-binding transcriptional ArsR family regulator